jgi:hypothetical protein
VRGATVGAEVREFRLIPGGNPAAAAVMPGSSSGFIMSRSPTDRQDPTVPTRALDLGFDATGDLVVGSPMRISTMTRTSRDGAWPT